MEAAFLPPAEAEMSVVAEAVVSLVRVGEPFSFEEEPLSLEGGAAARAVLGSNRHVVKASRLRNFMIPIVVSFKLITEQ